MFVAKIKNQPKIPGMLLDFLCYLIDHHEGDVISEEQLQIIMSNFLIFRRNVG